MENIPCPGCRTPLGPEQTSCPICLRTRSKYEITRAYARLREEDARRRRLPFKVAGWLLLASAVGYGLWFFRAPILQSSAALRAKAARIADEATDARNLVHRDPQAPAASTGTFDAPRPPEPAAVAASSAPVAAPPEPPSLDPNRKAIESAPAAGATGPVRLADMHLPAQIPPSQWVLYGRAYDLVTLKPARAAALAFQTSAGGMVAALTTDNYGRYAAMLPRDHEGGLSIASADPRYAPTVLCEPDIDYKALPADERRAMARSAADGDVRQTPLLDPTGDISLSRDLFLAPAR